MTAVTPERELTNNHLARAQELAAGFRGPRERTLAEFALALGSALVRAQREVDDDLWWVKEALIKHGIDLAAVGGEQEQFAEAELSPPASDDSETMMAERNLVDEALRRASQQVTGARAAGVSALDVHWMELGFQLVSAFVRQTRDLDDDLSHLRRAIEEHGSRVVVAFHDNVLNWGKR